MFKSNEAGPVKDQISPDLYERLMANKEAPGFDDFADTFWPEDISRDRDRMRECIADRGPEASQYEKSQKRWADAFEVLVCLQIGLGDWLGSDAMATFTSEYDDLVHRVDGVIEIRGEEGESSKDVRLGFDCTFSEQGLDKKIARMWDRLNMARLYDIKYFISPHSEEKLSLFDIPLVTVFTNKQMVQELAEQWSADKTKLNDHPFKFLVLEQILFQLLAMRAYLKASHCRARGTRRNKIQDRIDEVIEAVSGNTQKVLMASFDENILRYVSKHPHAREVQTRIERIFNLGFRNPVLPKGYATALQWALDRDAPSIIRDVPVPEVASSPVPKQETRNDIRFLSFVNMIRHEFGANISYSRVFRYAQEAESSSGSGAGIFHKTIEPSVGEAPSQEWLDFKSELVYIDTSLAEIVYERFKKLHEIPPAPDGWQTSQRVFEALDRKNIAIKLETVKKLAKLLSRGTEDIKLCRASNHRSYFFYSPDLILRIQEYCVQFKEKRVKIDVIPYEAGWKSIREIASGYKEEVSDATVRSLAYEHPNEMRFMRREGEQPIPRCSPALERLIDEKIKEKKDIPVPGPEEMTRPQIVDLFGGNPKIVFRVLGAAIKLHPEWRVQRRLKKGKVEWYYTKEAREAVKSELEYIRSLSEPKPWEMTNQAAARYLTALLKREFSGQPITIAPIADVTLQKALFRIVPSEKEREKLVHDRRTADGNYYPHLSPELIERLRQEFISIYETPVPSPGEVTRVEMVRRIQERFDIGKNAANDLINKFVAGKTECVVQRRRPEDTGLIKCYRADEIFRVLEAVSKGGS